jgi:AcrR family transcriptional regulator
MAYPSKINRRSILDVAMKLLASQGLAGMSLRSVAAASHVMPNALYRYFADLEQLKTAVAGEVAVLVHAALLKAISKKQAPEEAIRRLALAYMRFAKEQHLLYEALLVPRPASGEDAVGPERLWWFVVEQVSRVSGPEPASQATVAPWAFMHGMAALQSVDAFDQEKPFKPSFEFGLEAWMQFAKNKRSVPTKSKRNGHKGTSAQSQVSSV